MDTNRLKRFATEARNILMQGVAHRLSALGFLPDGGVTEEPQQQGGGATFMGDTVTQDFYYKWQSLRRTVSERGINEVAEEAAYTWFNRLVSIRILVKNGLASPVLEYESEDILVPLLVSEARQGRMPEMNADSLRKLTDLLDDDSKTSEQFALLIVAYCHSNPVINSCFGRISDYTELLLPTNILTEGGFVYMLNHTEFISEEDYRSPELIGWLYQFYISEKKDDVFASFKKGKKAEAKDIPAATQIFTPNWIVKYMVQNTVGRIYLDNNPYSDIKDSLQYLVEPEEATPADAIFRFDDIHDLTCADLACGSGHILNECFDLLYQLYIEEGYSRKNAIEDIFKYNLTGVDIDTRAKQLAQFALLLKACQKDSLFADAHCMPKVLDMPKVDRYTFTDNYHHFDCTYGIVSNETIHQELVDAFTLLEQAGNLGSIMKFDISDVTRDYMIKCIASYEFEPQFDNAFRPLLQAYSLILTLTRKYASLVMNPPYMGDINMNKELAQYITNNYPEGRVDLAIVFVKLMQNMTYLNGAYSFIVPPSWMFIKSFEAIRHYIIDNNTIQSLLHLSRGVFGADFGSSSCVIRNSNPKQGSAGTYFKLQERTFQEFEQGHLKLLFIKALSDKSFKFDFKTYSKSDFNLIHSHSGQRLVFEKVKQNYFKHIPGTPLGYWLSETFINLFDKKLINNIVVSKAGVVTGDDAHFLRFWYEPSFVDIDLTNKPHLKYSKYHLFQKGGGARKYYGNNEYVLKLSEFWDDKFWNKSIRRGDPDFYFKEAIGWSTVNSSNLKTFRLFNNFVCATSTATVYCNDSKIKFYLLGLLNTKLSSNLLVLYNPTIHVLTKDVCNIPYIESKVHFETVSRSTEENMMIAHLDWDAHETSWDFETNPLLEVDTKTYIDNIRHEIERHEKETGEHLCIDPAAPELDSLEWRMEQYKQKWEHLFMQLHANEEELNRQFIDIYGLQDELTPDVPLDEITILQQGEISIENDQIKWHDDVIIKQFISYAVGCMMGRYSIDKPGLILANQGDGVNEYKDKVPNSRFEVDDDGIIPLMASDTDFSDNATIRFKQWLTVAFGDTHLVENLNFIEGALGKSLDDYFVKDFWKDHKKMYQNRPIYWLFSSKKGAFQCIAYMHRMNAYIAERIRTKYLLPHIEWLLQKQSEMEENAANLSTAERRKLDSIRKQIAECREYHDRLHVVADEQIAFDLDDGVVVNYAKFGDVLAKIK